MLHQFFLQSRHDLLYYSLPRSMDDSTEFWSIIFKWGRKSEKIYWSKCRGWCELRWEPSTCPSGRLIRNNWQFVSLSLIFSLDMSLLSRFSCRRFEDKDFISEEPPRSPLRFFFILLRYLELVAFLQCDDIFVRYLS